MWKEIVKYSFTILTILGIPVYLWRISKGKHKIEETPVSNAIAMLVNVCYLIAFWLWFF